MPTQLADLKLARDATAALVLAMQASDFSRRAIGYFRVATFWAFKEALSRLQCGRCHPSVVALVIKEADERGSNHRSRAHRAFDRRGVGRFSLGANESGCATVCVCFVFGTNVMASTAFRGQRCVVRTEFLSADAAFYIIS